jgi:hypothetical protein
MRIGLSSGTCPAIAVCALTTLAGSVVAQDVSQPVILQWFEGRYSTIERRAADVFAAGYGSVYLPPTGRADQGNSSVGYDVYDRFDLGGPGKPTRYGTETGLKAAVRSLQRFNGNVYADFVINHNGFSDRNSVDGQGRTFIGAGGYPGIAVTLPGQFFGDFHDYNPPAGPDYVYQFRLSNLIDVDQRLNNRMVRNPVPGFNNIPAGTLSAFGRLANVPTESNRRFYPDQQIAALNVTDPVGGYSGPLYNFNTVAPMSGDPVEENAAEYINRNARWMIQEIGLDGFRVDAAKHVYPSVFPGYDRAVFRASNRTFLDGSQRPVYSFLEVLDANRSLLQSLIRKDANPAQGTVVKGNRDALDFPLFYAMRDNLTSNGAVNDWRNIKNASQDVQDDGLANNGSQGVAFVTNHDDENGAYLNSVAHAYILMRPGQAKVYFNGQEFGAGSFPRPGRDDALGGLYGDQITRLVEIRNTHGRGNYADRTPSASDEKNLLAYERQGSAVVLLNNQFTNGWDFRTVETSFPVGTRLVELTGNAARTDVDPTGVIDEVVTVVQQSGKNVINVRFPRNRNLNGVQHDRGYLVYGLAGPQGTLSIGGASGSFAAETPTPATNGSARLSSIDIIKGNTMTIGLTTTPVFLNNNPAFRDVSADGDTALFRINEGIDANNSGTVDFRVPGTPTYGFEEFLTLKQPGFFDPNGNGAYQQIVDTTQLAEGYHFIEVRAFRQRSDGGPAVYTPFRRTIYVDRLKPVSTVQSFDGIAGQPSDARDLIVRNTDQTADNVHVFLNLPANRTDAQVLALVNGSNQAGRLDRDLWAYGFFGVKSGNHVATIVTYEPTGNWSVIRVPGLSASTLNGLGLGDLNFNNGFEVGDVSGTSYGFEAVMNSQNNQFNPAADLNADGRIDTKDLFLLRSTYQAANAPAAVVNAVRPVELRRGNMNGDAATNAADIDELYNRFGNSSWIFDVASDGGPAGQTDMNALVRRIFLTEYGDANLDGTIDFDDYSLIDFGFLNNLAGWANGDFDGNDLIDFDDYSIIDFYFLQQSRRGMSAFPDWMLQQRLDWFGQGYIDWLAGAAVPEPGACGAVLALGALLARRARIN